MPGLLRLTAGREVEGSVKVNLPLSKSISNRLLILNAISDGKIRTPDYGNSGDTKVLRKCLHEIDSGELYVKDAGTACRFLTAYSATLNKQVRIVGTERMHQRPINALVDALRLLGAEIDYLENEGCPPLKINKGIDKNSFVNSLNIQSTSSSQYISALMLIAPCLKNGLEIQFQKDIPSYSYVEMTASLMQRAGLECQIEDEKIMIPNQAFKDVNIKVEKDWSSASYFIPLLLLGKLSEVFFPNLTLNSVQGDKDVIRFFEPLGIEAKETHEGLLVKRSRMIDNENMVCFDLKNNPDLAMTLAVAYALSGKRLKMTGLENLKYKESNRTEALATELTKLGARLEENDSGILIEPPIKPMNESIRINTYNDHRIAMSFSAAAMQSEIFIENPKVVSKSFPDFWSEISKFGLDTHYLTHESEAKTQNSE